MFLAPRSKLDPQLPNYGQVQDVSGEVVIRTAQDKSEDLKDFLSTLVGYLPFPYLTEKVVNASHNLTEVWDYIYEHYGLKISGDSLFDFVNMQQLSGESYRQYYDRLLAMLSVL